jgi:MoaA/NifB/PqqE/SkfB family radical SAM enzyme
VRTVNVAAGEHIRLFNTLAIETSAVCNRSCVFCPVHRDDRPDEYMSMNTIRKIVDELRFLRWAGRITTYIYNEPMRDKRLVEILQLMRKELPRVCLMVSTNGDYLRSRGDIDRLFEAGVNQLLINVYSASDGSADSAKVERGVVLARTRETRIREWVDQTGVFQRGSVYTYLRPPRRVCHVVAKYGVNNNDRNLADYELQNRSGNIEWFQPGLTNPLERGCVRPFRFLNINWRGDGILCCNDYHGVTNFGNVAEKSLVEIWNHPALHLYRKHLQDRDRHVPLCDKCDYRGGVYPHMIERVSGI